MTTSQQELSQEAQDAVRRVEKLLKLAAKNSNEHEAAAATAKAQEILAQYNLDVAFIEQNSSDKGRREEAKVKGGLYHYQRELWEAVADLNFCMYWNQYRYDKTKWRVKKRRNRWSDQTSRERVQGGFTFEHVVVGRVINTTVTRTMAEYLLQTIERLTRERLGNDGSQFFTNWAISYREGLASAVIHKIYDRRKHLLAAEKRRQAEDAKRAADLATKGASTATALTLADVRKSEEQANYDFLHGDGAHAKREQSRQRYAEEQARAEAEYAQWAEANPEEARKLEEKERKRRRSYGPASYADNKWKRRDHSAYMSGSEAGKSISIEPQTDTRKAAARIGR